MVVAKPPQISAGRHVESVELKITLVGEETHKQAKKGGRTYVVDDVGGISFNFLLFNMSYFYFLPPGKVFLNYI